MSPTDEEIRVFLDRFGSASFANADAITRLLRARDGSSKVDVHDGASLPELRATYRSRAEWLASTRPKPTLPPQLPEEVLSLSDALEAAADQPVRIWQIALPDGTLFVLFELLHASSIAGAIKTVDRRMV